MTNGHMFVYQIDVKYFHVYLLLLLMKDVQLVRKAVHDRSLSWHPKRPVSSQEPFPRSD